MKVLVTGSNGFVGRRIVKKCVELKYSITGVDNLSTGLTLHSWPDIVKPRGFEFGRVTMVVDDIRHYMRTYAKAHEFDLIFHCAAVVGGRATIEGAPLKVATDLSIDAEFFNWCCAEKELPRKVIYFSSSAVYPAALQTGQFKLTMSEGLCRIGVDKIGMPDHTYGWAKLSGEVLMHHAVKTYGLDCVCYRPFSGYGEEQDFSYPFPSLMRRIANREDPIEIWGTGEQVRDFIHIEDVVEIVFASYEKMKPGETINLASGVATSFKELVKLARLVSGHKGRIKTLPDKPEGVMYRVGDTWLMLKYGTPTITLEDGIRRSLAYLTPEPNVVKVTT